MGLFDSFRKKTAKKARPAPHPPLFSLCYNIAYFILPHYAKNDPKKIIDQWTDTPNAAGPFLYLWSCEFAKTEPKDDEAILFRAHLGKLNINYDYYLLEYPTPPPVDFSGVDLEDLATDKADDLPVLAPYFSALLHNPNTNTIAYFVLGQSPLGGGTTLRKVGDDVNMNLGPGPSANLEDFLYSLRMKNGR
jgi:hypothetical protein